MNSHHGRFPALRSTTGILLSLLLIVTALPVHRSSASIADLPYRLVPAMTSSIGADLKSLSSSGTYIVWEDSRSGQPDVFAYDISDAREFRPSRSQDVRRQPAIDGSIIVWVSGLEPGERTIRGIDLAEGIEFVITEDPSTVERPAISGNTISWQRRSENGWRIHLHDMSTGRESVLSDDNVSAARPSMDGQWIVWQEHDGESWNIRVHDTDVGESRDIANTAADEQYPVISEGRIAFVRTTSDGGPPHLVLVDLNGGEELVISDSHFIMQPEIAGDLVVWEDWRSGLPDIFAYDLRHQQMFAVARSQQAAGPVVSDRMIAWISGSNPRSQRVQGLQIDARLPSDPQDPPAVPDPDRLYVQQTRHFVSSGFKSFWQARGGPQLLGYPLTEEFEEENPETGEILIVQYFERGKLEYHPDAPESERIRMARLGIQMRPEREAEPIEPFESDDGRRYFPQTGHGVSHGFKEFWEDNGGVGIFGFPVSGEFVENGRTVQYFERARFEYNPESEEGSRIQLGLIGREALQNRGWLPPPPVDTTRIFD